MCKKYQRAKDAVETMDSAVEELTNAIGNSSWISEWTKSENIAKKKRGKALMIYNVTNTSGVFIILCYFNLILKQQIAPSKAEKQQKLLQSSKKSHHVQWLSEGLNLEVEQ